MIGGMTHASVWSGTAESWIDLHEILPLGVYLESNAGYIEVSDGQIWVSGYANNTYTGVCDAIVWHYTPDAVPEPSGLLVLGSGMLALAGMIRKKHG